MNLDELIVGWLTSGSSERADNDSFLKELGLVDMNGRAYDPLQRRFLPPDLIVADPLFGPAYNRYANALNNPIRYTDPSGFKVVPTSSVVNAPLPAVTGCGFEAVGACGDSAPPPLSGTPSANAIPSSTGCGATPPTGGTSGWGPAMSDVPAFDADKAAAGELELSTGSRLWATLVEMDNACGLVQQGLMDRAAEMVVETGILAINATSPPAAELTRASRAVDRTLPPLARSWFPGIFVKVIVRLASSRGSLRASSSPPPPAWLPPASLPPASLPPASLPRPAAPPRL